MAISTAFNTAVSGLKAHQTALDVTSNNISNASNKDYVRERAVFSDLKPINTIPGDIGIGVHITTINRITDTFLFNRFTDTSANLNSLSTQEQYLQEIGTYFPDVTDQGLYKDLKDFFNAWQNLASNPNDGSVKVALANSTQKLTDTFHNLRDKLADIRKSANEEIDARVKEANNIIKNIAKLNKEISRDEANGLSHANELRDKRDALEKRLKEILDVKVFKTGITSQDTQGLTTVDYGKEYSITLGGYPIVSGSSAYEITTINKNGNLNIGVTKEDFSVVDVTKSLNKSEIGALVKIRGDEFNSDGTPKNGVIGDLISSLDNLAASLIRSVNSIYSYSAQEEATGITTFKPISISPDMKNMHLDSLYSMGVLDHSVKDGILKLDLTDNNGNKLTTLQVSIKKSDTLQNVLDKINDKISSYDNNFDVKADIVNGEIKFVPADTNGDNQVNPKGNVLVKDDGSLIFSAFREYEYLPIDKINDKLPLKLQDGGFDVVVYDDNGDIKAQRHIIVDSTSDDPRYNTLQGIINQINTSLVDDNQDNDTTNDVDDYYKAVILNGKVIIHKKSDENVYVGLDNDKSNFGGVFGINQFLEGNNASNISLAKRLKDDPSQIHAYKAPNEGNNDVANDILELQYEKINFDDGSNATLFEYYRQTTTDLATQINEVSQKKDTAQTLFKSISNEYYSLSGVNIDEELINLEKFQRGYQANAKVITTINAMLDALFGIKQ